MAEQAIFTREVKVRFADADYAGIMFYPRYFEMLNSVVEDWFGERTGGGFHKLLDEMRCGAPLGNIETRFVAPCHIGDVLTFTLEIKSFKEKTITFEATTRCDGELRAVATLTVICVHRDMSGARAWPDAIKNETANHA